MTNSAPFRVVGFKKLFFVNLSDMSYKNLYKRIQKCWLYAIWLFLLADLFSVSRAEYDQFMYTTLKHGGSPIAIHVRIIVCRWSIMHTSKRVDGLL